MEIIQSHYPVMLLYSLAIGAVLSAVWDIFRIAHIALRPIEVNKSLILVHGTVLFICDVVFAFISALIITVFTFHVNEGRFRLISLASVLLGFLIYRHTVGRVVMLLSDKIISIIYKTVHFIYMHTLHPIL